MQLLCKDCVGMWQNSLSIMLNFKKVNHTEFRDFNLVT